MHILRAGCNGPNHVAAALFFLQSALMKSKKRRGKSEAEEAWLKRLTSPSCWRGSLGWAGGAAAGLLFLGRDLGL